MIGNYRVFHRRWRSLRAVWWLLPVELLCVIPVLALFGIADPDTYRTTLWKVGAENGFNSSPNVIVFAHVNARPIPTVPLVWSQIITTYNVAISIIAVFQLIAKLIVVIMKVYTPIVGVVTNLILVILFTVSVYGQMGPDYLDPNRPSPIAWYISRDCEAARPWGAVKYCEMAKGAFAATVVLLFVYLVGLGLSVWSMIPSDNDHILDDDEESMFEAKQNEKEEKEWEMNGLQRPPPASAQPFTPRTLAFKTLDRNLPLRSS